MMPSMPPIVPTSTRKVRMMSMFCCSCCCIHVPFPATKKRTVKLTKGWVPVPLRVEFWIPLVVVMILLAIGLEIALHYSNQNSGGSGMWVI
jgi:hypothetical protein